MKHLAAFLLYAGLIALLFGCASPNVFVLLPDQDGQTGSIEVINTKGSQTIARPGETIAVASADRAPKTVSAMSEKEIKRTFKDALAAEPSPPEIFLLYFHSGTSRLTDQAAGLLPDILAAIKNRKSLDISVIGHSDRAGSRDYNLALSTKRAEQVRDLLVAGGADAQTIAVTSHGEGNPLIPTADDVEEPRNRRVEVVVR
ncbi:MAG: OmpA family protein [Desulforudis sp.]|nr:MAG: OmpA family protein [Desulforudis sp.]